MAARALVLVVAIAFSPSCCTASYDWNHDFEMVEGSQLSLIQTAMQQRGTQAKTKQPHPGRDALSTDSGATCMMMGDGGCTESWKSFADISSASSISSMNVDADASMGADDSASDFEKMPSSKSLSLGLIVNVLTFLVCFDMLRLWYVKRSGDNSEDDAVSGPEAPLADAVEDNEETPLMEPITTRSSSGSSSLFHLAAGNEGVSVVETLPAPAREGALQSLIALVSRFEGDEAETVNANEDFPDDSEDVFENGWDGWTWKEAAETTVGAA